jgi:homoserine dehydrogenase
MSAVLAAHGRALDAAPRAGVALLGLGTVGRAWLARLARLQQTGLARELQLRFLANSRGAARLARAADATPAVESLRSRSVRSEAWRELPPGSLIVDATASAEVAAEHAAWLDAGHAIVTANKLGRAGPIERHRHIERAAARYGDAATVGAGLPILESLRRLRAGGDRIVSIAGVLSGTLAWLLDGYDGTTAFGARVREAHARGYTEPDPRVDLSGEDVRRKLVVLARAAGFELEAHDVAIRPLIDDERGTRTLDEALVAAEPALAARAREATAVGEVLRYVARLDERGARIGLEALAPDDPLAGGRGCDNRVAIRSCRYAASALVIQGPGAGAEVTAAALIDDALRITGATA